MLRALGFISFALFLLASTLCGIDYFLSAHNTIKDTREKSKQLVAHIDAMFLKAEQLIDKRLKALEANPQKSAEWLEALKSEIEKDDTLAVYTFGIAFEPYAYTSEQKLFAPMYVRQTQLSEAGLREPEGSYHLIQLDEQVDYTRKYNPQDSSTYDSRWYHQGLVAESLNGTGVWQTPYYGQVTKTMLSEYSRPFYGIHPVTGKREKLGMVYLDLALEDLRNVIKKLDFETSAYGSVVTNEGIIVSHPIRSWLAKNLQETIGKHNPSTAIEMTTKIKQGLPFKTEFNDAHSGQTYISLYEPISTNHWSFGLTILKVVLYPFTLIHKLYILVALAALGFTLMAIIAVRHPSPQFDNSIGWKLSNLACGWSLLMTVTTLSLFYSVDNKQSRDILFNPTDLDPVVEESKRDSTDTYLIPTGVLIQDIKFLGTDEVSISGIVWQNVPDTLPEQAIGVNFADTRLNSITKEKIFQKKKNHTTTLYGWRFTSQLRYEGSVGRYPFDERLIQLKLIPDTNDYKVILTPAFYDYDLLVPSALPGIHEKLRMKYWNLEESYFSYSNHSMDDVSRLTTALNAMKPLLFNVKITRRSLSPIVAYVLPIFIGSLMIFIVLMIPNDRSSGLVFSTLSYGGTIYFVISIFHVGLRNAEGIDGLSYLESYYIIMHAMVMLVSLNRFLLMMNRGPKWIHTSDNV
ncbi:MAG: hypothetical protein P8176_15265, partial [Gammaproteobacteria bacterium]